VFSLPRTSKQASKQAIYLDTYLKHNCKQVSFACLSSGFSLTAHTSSCTENELVISIASKLLTSDLPVTQTWNELSSP
jgi:hypothetical protein